MKRRGAQALRKKLEGKSAAEQRAYWRERTQALRQRQAGVQNAGEDKH